MGCDNHLKTDYASQIFVIKFCCIYGAETMCYCLFMDLTSSVCSELHAVVMEIEFPRWVLGRNLHFRK